MNNSKITKDEWVSKIQNMLNKTVENGATEQEAESAMLMAQKLMAKYGLEMADIEANSNDGETNKEIMEGYGNDGIKVSWWHKSLAHIVADNFRCYFFLRAFHKDTRIVFMGLKEDVEVAKSIFKFAVIQIEHHAKVYRKKRRKELEDKILPEGFKKFSFKEVIEFAIENGVADYIVDGICGKYLDEAIQRKFITKEIKKALGGNFDGPAVRNDYIRGFLAGLKEKFKEQVKQNEAEWGLVLVKDADLVAKYEDLTKQFKTAKASSGVSQGDMGAYNAGVKQGRKFTSASGQIE